MTEEAEYENLSWDEIVSMCRHLAFEIWRGFAPDVIVAISRGGLIPARILADFLGIKRIYVMGIEFYEEPGRHGKKPRITQQIPKKLVKRKKVLLVDDISDTGESLKAARKQLKGALRVKTATLSFKPKSKYRPDFFVQTTTKWVVYPWEKEETYKGGEIDKMLKETEFELSEYKGA
ncbi:MAG: phosphoribosyltransferase [Candidatus Micrarchaeia archaeon]